MWRINNERGCGSGIIARAMVVSEPYEEVPTDEWVASDYWLEEVEEKQDVPCIKLEFLESKLTEGNTLAGKCVWRMRCCSAAGS